MTDETDAFDREEARWRSLVTGIPQLVWRAERLAHWSWASPQWSAFTGQPEAESRGLGWLDPVHPDDRGAALAAWEEAGQKGGFDAEYRLRRASDGSYRCFQARATPVRRDDGEIVEWLGTSTDVDDLRSLERRHHLLLVELQHRVRNSLAVIKSIVRRTAESSRTVDDMAAHLSGRIEAFARVQAAVTRNPSGGVELTTLVVDEMLAHATQEGDRLSLKGPPIWLTARAAESISLALHELATNAVEHGALAHGVGGVSVRWSIEGGRLHFAWTETGGPKGNGAAPGHGFGMTMLLESLPYDLGAKTDLRFGPRGLVFSLDAPESILVGTRRG